MHRVIDDITELGASGFSSGDVPEWDGSVFAPVGRGTSPWDNMVIYDERAQVTRLSRI